MIPALADKVIFVTPPGAKIDNTSPTTGEIDTLGFAYLRYIVGIGDLDIAVAAMKVTESDTAGSGHGDITGADFSVSPASLPGATDDNKLYAICINLKGRKRYIDLTLTGGDGSTGAYFTVIAELSKASSGPLTAAEQGFAQRLIV